MPQPKPRSMSELWAQKVSALENEQADLAVRVPQLEEDFKALPQPVSYHGSSEERTAAHQAWTDAANRASEVEFDLKEARRAYDYWQAVDGAESGIRTARQRRDDADATLQQVQVRLGQIRDRIAATESDVSGRLRAAEDLERLAAEEYAAAVADGDEARASEAYARTKESQEQVQSARDHAARQEAVLGALRSQEQMAIDQASSAEEERAAACVALGNAIQAKYKARWDELVAQLEGVGRTLVAAAALGGVDAYGLFSRDLRVPRFAPSAGSLTGSGLWRDEEPVELREAL